MKLEQEHIVVIVDPCQQSTVALERALVTAKIRNQPPVLHVLVAGNQELDANKPVSDNLVNISWLEQLKQQLTEAELEHQLELNWATPWYDVAIAKVEHVNADMIIVPDDSDAEGHIAESHWRLVRELNCPVLIAKPEAQVHRKVVLAAVKMQSGTDNKYDELNKKIIDRGQWMAEKYGAQLHVVNSYSNSKDYPDKGMIVRKTGLAAENIHIMLGDVDEAISQVADKVDADIVVIGTMRRKGLRGALRGNTSEKVMARLTHDLMTLTLD